MQRARTAAAVARTTFLCTASITFSCSERASNLPAERRSSRAFPTPMAAAHTSPFNTKPWRAVTTAFVQRRSDGRVLVVRRSDKVLEEAGIPSHHLQLECCGRPLPVVDGHRHFLVHPFLFSLRPGAAEVVNLNWENTAHSWVSAEELSQLPTVPLLLETLSRLVLPPVLQQHVNYLVADRDHGAAQLARYVVDAFAAQLQPGGVAPDMTKAACDTGDAGDNVGRTRGGDAGHLRDQDDSKQQDAGSATTTTSSSSCLEGSGRQLLELLLDFGFRMATCRPSMAAIANAAAAVLLQLQHNLQSSSGRSPGGGGEEQATHTRPEEGEAGGALLTRAAIRDALQAAVEQEGARLQTMAATATTQAGNLLAQQLLQQQLHQDPGRAQTGQAVLHPHSSQQACTYTQAVLTTSLSSGVYRTLLAAREALASTAESDTAGHSSRSEVSAEGDTSGVGSTRPAVAAPATSTTAESGRVGASTAAEAAPPATSTAEPAAGPPPVIVCESRPLCEGVTLARQLSSAGFETTIVTDAQVYTCLGQVGAVLLGCDAITEAGPVNKVGSALLALAAQHRGLPVYVVGDSLKVSPGAVMASCLPYVLQGAPQQQQLVQQQQRVKGGPGSTAGSQEAQGIEANSISAAGSQQERCVEGVPSSGEAGQQQLQQAAAAAAAEEEMDWSELLAAWKPADAAAVSATLSRTAAEQTHVRSQLMQDQDPSRSSRGASGSLHVRNVYFEVVPWDLVTCLVTDTGVLGAAAVAEQLQQQRLRYLQAFQLTTP